MIHNLNFIMISMLFPLKFWGLKKRVTDEPTNGWTNQPTDSSYRDAVNDIY